MRKDVTPRLLELAAQRPLTYSAAAKALGTSIASLRVLVHRQVRLGTLRVTWSEAKIERCIDGETHER